MYIDWPNKIIHVLKSDMTLIQSSPLEIYELDLNWFRLTLRSLEDDPDGMGFLRTHKHNTEVTLGGLTFARVIEIINGYTVTFEDGQYAVNLVGANSNVGDVVNVNQVSVRASNSAGLISSKLIEYASFQNMVCIDEANGSAGTISTKGTIQDPVNNWNDALLIANYRGLNKFYIIGNATLNVDLDFTKKEFIGESINKTTLTINSAPNVTECEFRNMTVEGVLDGNSTINNCDIKDLNYIYGVVENSMLNGTITLGGTGVAHFLNCNSGKSVYGSKPVIDMNGSGVSLNIKRYSGELLIKNHNGPEDIMLDLFSAVVTLDSTLTNGDIVVRGLGEVVDNNGDPIASGNYNGTNVILKAINQDSIEKLIMYADMAQNFDPGTFGEVINNILKKAKLAATKL